MAIGKRQTSDSSSKFLKLDWYEQAVSVLLWKEHEVRNAIAVLRITRTLATILDKTTWENVFINAHYLTQQNYFQINGFA